MAIAMVLLSHAGETMADPYGGLLYPLGWFAQGTDGVTIFFVLSGYLITSILVREYDAQGRIDIKAFYCRRILRIFPAFYTYLIFIAVLAGWGVIDLSRTYIALAAAHLINYAAAFFLITHTPDPGGPSYWFVAHFWSLSMEEQFYWIWPASLLLLLRTRWYGLLVGLILALPVVRITSYFLFPGLRGQLMIMLHTGSDAIFCGCLLALFMARHRDWVRKLLVPWWVIVLLAVFFFRIEPELVAREHGDHSFVPRGYSIVVGATLMVATITVLIANVLLQERETWYTRVLAFPPLVWLGRISYSVYLWQQLFLTNQNTTWLGKWPANMVAVLAIGTLSYFCIETPFVRIKDKYFPAHTKPAAAPVAG